VKAIVQAADFSANLTKVITMLEPIDRRIVKYQNDACPISEVIPQFVAMSAEYKQLQESRHLTKKDYETIESTLNDRYDFLISSAHRMAYLLDPRFFGQLFTKEERKATEKDVVQWFGEKESGSAYSELSRFLSTCKDEKECNSWDYQHLESGARTPAQFWDISNDYPLLQVLARRLFTLVPSSASAERFVILTHRLIFFFRCFSAMGFLQTDRRNRLASNTVNKLMFVRCNNMVMNEASEDESDDDL
jgi:hypothetical protein